MTLKDQFTLKLSRISGPRASAQTWRARPDGAKRAEYGEGRDTAPTIAQAIAVGDFVAKFLPGWKRWSWQTIPGNMAQVTKLKGNGVRS